MCPLAERVSLTSGVIVILTSAIVSDDEQGVESGLRGVIEREMDGMSSGRVAERIGTGMVFFCVSRPAEKASAVCANTLPRKRDRKKDSICRETHKISSFSIP